MKSVTLAATAAVFLATTAGAHATGSHDNVYQGASAGAGALASSHSTGVGTGVGTGGAGGAGVASLDSDVTHEGNDYPALGVLITPGDFAPGSAPPVSFGTQSVILQDSTKVLFFAWSRQRVEMLPQATLAELGRLDELTDAQVAFLCDSLGLAEYVRAEPGQSCPDDTIADLR